jgi:hypothetical protein
MNGLVFIGLRNFVHDKLGREAWSELLAELAMGPRLFVPVVDYPDEDLVKLVTAVSKKTAKPIGAVFEEFGAFIAPEWMTMFASLIKPEWKTLDLLANTEETIHEVLRQSNKHARPPKLVCTRTSDREVSIIYSSPRRLCHLAKGFARGIAGRFGETIAITEPSCMLRGSPHCELRVELAG